MERVSNEDAERLLEDLVAIPSPSGQEKRASSFLVEWMSQRGLDAHVDEAGSAVGVRGEGEREVVLLGHVDTFPGELPVRRVGRKLHGRGSVDAKGPLAAFLVAAANIRPAKGMKIVVVGATEEEAPTSRGANHAVGEYQPVCCIIGEPSGWDRICIGYKGRLNLRWSWRGPLAHSSAPTPTPGEVAFAVWDAVHMYIEEFNHERTHRFEQLQSSLQSINTKQDGAFGEASMTIALRLPPGCSSTEMESEIARLFSEGDLEFSGPQEPYVAGKSNDLTRALLAGIRDEQGNPRFVVKTGTSDMNVVGPRWSCPIVAYGPGDSQLDHTPEENLDLDEYIRSIRVLEKALVHVIQA